ncbi:MAG: CBS domain-containing protein [Kofleriaceae bacterium]
MTRHPHAVASRTTLSSARELMGEHKIHHLPAIDHDRLVGILNDQDLQAIHTPEDHVADAMTVDVATVPEATPLDEVVTLMDARKLSSVVVMGGTGVAGIFTLTDAMRAFCNVLEREEAGQR